MNMQFINSNYRNNVSIQQGPVPLVNNININNRFRSFFNNQPSSYVKTNIIPPRIIQEESKVILTKPDEPNKMKWGEPIWYLFHTLAEKVKEGLFPVIKTELLNTIYSICSNLPCPKCRKHAVEYMDNVNFNSINSKNDLKLFLYQFHNTVNKRKNYPLFSYIDLDDKYSKANTANIIKYFLIVFNKTDFNVTMLTENMNRKLVANKISVWFNKNIQYFDT